MSRRYRHLLVVAALSSSAVIGGGVEPIDQLEPGPFPTATWDWQLEDAETTDPLFGTPLMVEHFGRLHYPSDGSPGALPPVSPDGPFPLVVFGHGRFQEKGAIGTNHLEWEYLMERLASWGVIAVAVNLDVVGQFNLPAAIDQRGDLMLATVAAMLELDALAVDPPSGLASSLDGSRIGLAGHSRGGEGAVAAALDNLESFSPFAIRAVATLAATDFDQLDLRDVSYLGLYGSKDGDVTNGWPVQLHDRAASEEKVFEYVHGANHFWFTETTSCPCETDPDFTRELHQEIALGYVAGFLVRRLDNPPLSAAVFADGPELAPLTSEVEILPMYRNPVRLVLDDFESQPDLGTSSAGLPVNLRGLLGPFEAELNFSSLYHETAGLSAPFDGATALWAVTLPAALDTSPWTHLSAKFAQSFYSPLNVPDMPQDVTVALIDDVRRVAAVPLSDHGTIAWPASHPDAHPYLPPRTVLRTTRIPLSAFADANPSVDLARIRWVAWRADRTPSGELLFDDLELTR